MAHNDAEVVELAPSPGASTYSYHSSPFVPPKRSVALSGWALLPLRAFLGITFTFAALQKIANPAFFSPTSTSGITAQMHGAITSGSPLRPLLEHLLTHASTIGWLIAFGELAIGIGALVGLLTRVAAAGGAVLSFSLFLVISFHQTPYYTGADIVFTFAWLPLVVAGAGAVSLDAALAKRSAKAAGTPDPTMVAIAFGRIQQLCGNHDGGHCSALDAICESGYCPFLAAPQPKDDPSAADESRRTVLATGVAASVTAVGALATAAAVGEVGRHATSTPTTTPVTLAPGSTPTQIGLASSIPVGGSASFVVPNGIQSPGIVIQTSPGVFRAFNATCTHEGCPCAYQPNQRLIVCPCHGSEFSPDNGDVVLGPAAAPLTEYPVTVSATGELTIKL